MKKKEIPVVLDPTLLLTKEDWAKLFSLKEKKGSYLLAYFLGNNEKHIITTSNMLINLLVIISLLLYFSLLVLSILIS